MYQIKNKSNKGKNEKLRKYLNKTEGDRENFVVQEITKPRKETGRGEEEG